MADACSRSRFKRGSIGFAPSRRAEKKKTPQLAGLKVDLSIRSAPPMTGPLGENEVEIGELGDHDFNKSVADFHYRRRNG